MPADHDDLHFEPFIHLAGLDDDQALIAWGGFWFRPFEDGRGWRIVDDEQLSEVDPGRTESIGVRSAPYGHARVEVFDEQDRLVATAATDEANHVWVRGLAPGTEHRYEIIVDGRPWAPEECMRWHRIDDERGELRPAGRTYDCRFRTFPGGEHTAGMRFAALGDYGVGIQTGSALGDHQLHLARVLEQLLDDPGLDLVVTLGDNIYHQESESVGGSGAEDDDWYFSFYEPYRFVINRVPVYPTVGNHDAAETEVSDDRAQLADNHFTDLRFDASVEEDRASVSVEQNKAPGLFYRFSFGDLVEFVCIDTSEAGAFEAERFFDEPEHVPFLREVFDPDRDRPRWLVPFSHHPAYTAGPHHHNDEAQLRSLVPRYRDAGVQVVLAGHEHNFQHALADGIHHLVCGAGGKLREGEPRQTAEAHTRSWAAQPHLLLVDVERDAMTLLPVARLSDGGRPLPIDIEVVAGQEDSLPIVVAHRS
jgi:tartrate-resistant acid phosphatase type 5